MRVGILTGGGLAPGTNAVIAGIALLLKQFGHRALGVPKGWSGLLRQQSLVNFDEWDEEALRQLTTRPGTMLRSSRAKVDAGNVKTVLEHIQQQKIDAIIAVGGDDTQASANCLKSQGYNALIGVPKTIDNDLFGTDVTYGHWSAVDVAAKHVELMRTEARDMVRVAIVEIMGRNAGWLAARGGSAGGADIELIPEMEIETSALLARIQDLFNRHEHAVIAVGEGYRIQDEETYQTDQTDPSGHKKLGGVGKRLAAIIENELNPIQTQVQVPGYAVRGEAANAFDRNFARGLGALAAGLIHDHDFGKMAALRNGEIVPVPLEEAKGGHFVPVELYDSQAMQMHLLTRQRLKAVLW